MMTEEPKMQGMMPQMTAAQPQGMLCRTRTGPGEARKQEPLNLTDDHASLSSWCACCHLAVSKPIQDKLATSIPKFLNEQGGRSMVGLSIYGCSCCYCFLHRQGLRSEALSRLRLPSHITIYRVITSRIIRY